MELKLEETQRLLYQGLSRRVALVVRQREEEVEVAIRS